MSRTKSGTSGFTIVELLIVIVVIAILASISVVAYTGIQHRATNTARISDVRKMNSLIRQYLAMNGAASFRALFPAGAGNFYCLGEGYIDVDPGSDASCYEWSIDPVSYDRSLPSLNNALKQLGNYSISALEPIDVPPDKTSAPEITSLASNYFVDGAPGFAYVWYQLHGYNVDCVLRPILRHVNIPDGNVNYTTSHSNKNSLSYGNVTNCWLYIREP